MKRLTFYTGYHYLPGWDSTNIVESLAGKHLYENFPQMDKNFPELRYIYWDDWLHRGPDLLHFNYSPPQLRRMELV